MTNGQLWFTVQTKPRQEAIALDNLERQGFQVYLPKIQLRKHRRKQWQQVIEPLFPSYLFINVNPDKTSLSPVRSTLGVTRLVRFGQILQPVPEPIITYLKAMEDTESGQLIEKSQTFDRGDEVEILSGPFEGLTAVYQLEKSADRILLLLNILGGLQQVYMGKDDIRPL